jgi:two-component system sensor histidine kinase KdpD
VPFPATAPERGALRILGPIEPAAVVNTDRLLLAFAEEASVALHRVRLAAEARRAEALERADRFKAVLLSTVSHDLRSPLTAMKGAVGNLRAGDIQWSEDDVARFLETIEAQTDRLTAIVSDLLQMSRLEGGAAIGTSNPLRSRRCSPRWRR